MDPRPNQPPADDQAVYGMAVASELTGVNPPMLRAYEAKGLIQPHRTSGGTRRYSADDITDVRRITALLDEGLNLAGVEAVLALETENRQLRAEVERLRAALGGERRAGQEEQAEPRGTL
jgi:MerR family transcriptional regulator, heat shock protein HspR